MDRSIIVFFCLFFLTTNAWATKAPLTSYYLKHKLTKYHDSGKYHRDINLVISHAKKCLEQQIPNTKNPALVLDIDDTSLMLYEYSRIWNFDLTPKEIEFIMQKANPPAVSATLNLYNFAKKHGVAVFFISGRHEAWRNNTIKSLQMAGYKNWDGLYLRPDEYHNQSITPFKSGSRKIIRSQGYNIIGNIGDQLSDLAGENIRCTYKLPNPYYFIAEEEIHISPFLEHEELN